MESVDSERFIIRDYPMHCETCAVVTIDDLINNFDEAFIINFIDEINSMIKNNIHCIELKSLINSYKNKNADKIYNTLLNIEKHCIYNLCTKQFIMYDPVQQDYKEIWNKLKLKNRYINNSYIKLHEDSINIDDVIYYREENIISNKDILNLKDLINNDINIAYTENIDNVRELYKRKDALFKLNQIIDNYLDITDIHVLIQVANELKGGED